jgi:anthranilate synthase/aminodeoxychorismate synthase-like glutamine amidotransferase
VLIIDNYDSFTYNLVQYFKMLKGTVQVYRNDEINLDDIDEIKPSHIVISPGPCTPRESGVSLKVIKMYYNKLPILGVCLGHQSIAYTFGSEIIKAKEPVHGKVWKIHHNNTGVFMGIKNPLNVTRYHSLVINPDTIPDEFVVTAWTDEGEIMGIKHKSYPLEGIQFHPEAVLTEYGLYMLNTFLTY